MRLDNGKIVIDKLTVPLQVQELILPIILLHIPEACKAIGINFKTYWDFDLRTRKQFLINAIRSCMFPTTSILKDILLRERKSVLEQFLSWVNYTDRAGLDPAHMKWFDLLTEAFSRMNHEETHKVWKKMHDEHIVLVKYVRVDFLPMILHEFVGMSNDRERAIAERRLKQN